MFAFQGRNILNADRIGHTRRNWRRHTDHPVLSRIDTRERKTGYDEVRLARRGQMHPLGKRIAFMDTGFAEQRRRVYRKIRKDAAAAQHDALGAAVSAIGYDIQYRRTLTALHRVKR